MYVLLVSYDTMIPDKSSQYEGLYIMACVHSPTSALGVLSSLQVVFITQN